MILIGITGAAGSGKDTVGAILREAGFASVAFADPLKNFVKEAWGLPDDVLWGPSELRAAPIETCACGWVGVGPVEAPVCPACQSHGTRPIMAFHCPPSNGCGYVGPDCDVEDAIGNGDLCNYCPKCGWGGTGAPPHGFHEAPLTPRLALQRLGTEFGRALDPNVWVRLGIRRAEEAGRQPFYTDRPHDDAGWWAYPPQTFGPLGRVLWPDRIGPFEEIPSKPPTVAGVVVTDVRFPNEAEAIRAAGGVVWRVRRFGSRCRGDAPGGARCALQAGHNAPHSAFPPEDPKPKDSWRSHSSETSMAHLVPDQVINNSGTLDDLQGTVRLALAALRGVDDAVLGAP